MQVCVIFHFVSGKRQPLNLSRVFQATLSNLPTRQELNKFQYPERVGQIKESPEKPGEVEGLPLTGYKGKITHTCIQGCTI